MIVFAVVLTTGLLVGGAWWALSGGLYGCTPRDERFAVRLSELDVLDVRPPGATPQDDRYQGCDEDDGFAYAGQSYLPAGDPASVVRFYRDEFTGLGWRLRSQDDDPVPEHGLVSSGARLCLTREIEGTTAYLTVWFPADFGEAARQYGVEVTASHDGGAWC